MARRAAPRAAGLAFVAGVVYYALLVSWSWYFGTIAIVPLVLVLAAYWAGGGRACSRWLRGRGASPTRSLIAAVWVLAEGDRRPLAARRLLVG